MNKNKFIFLDIFWDAKKNGGTLQGINPCFDEKLYWWKCYGCEESYQATLKKVLLSFKRNPKPQLNNFCASCKGGGVNPKYSYDAFIDYIKPKDRNYFSALAEDFVNSGSSTFSFYVYCPDCGEHHKATSITFESRNGFYCKDCYARRKSVNNHGSLASEMPSILPYLSSRNKFDANRIPVWSATSNSNHVYLICPNCKSEHRKRMDSVIRNGAYCGPCAKHRNACKGGNSLYENFPEVAKMFDKGGNSISSKEISYGSSKEYNFYCDNGDIPHIIVKRVTEMVSAYKRGSLGCPVCQGHEIQKGVNDFESRSPETAKYWDYDRNIKNPSDVGYKSTKKYYFKCSSGHSFEKSVYQMRMSLNTKNKGCPVCHGKSVITGVNDLYTLRPDLANKWDYDINSINPWEVSVSSNRAISVRCNSEGCGNVFTTSVYSWVNSLVVACECCRKRQSNENEKEIANLIRSWGFSVIENSDILGEGKHLGIYLPDENVAIDYNSLCLNSDTVMSDTNYYHDRYMLCKSRGIRLIYVWEDDFLYKKDVLIRSLKRKLGVSDERKIDASECSIGVINYPVAKEFLDINDIHGGINATEYICLRDSNGVIVSLVVIQEDGYMLNMKRYTSSCNVVGGFSMLLDYIEKTHNYIGVYTFSDNGFSCGSLYEENGFCIERYVRPDYSYIIGGIRKHKFNYRKSKFKEDPDLFFDDGLSETELAFANRLVRVWDAGKVKWFKRFERNKV